MVFTGNPGTGKTTVARIVSDIFYKTSISKKRHVVETSRDNLIGQYIGETEKKTRAVIESAMGGVLFIDEAYSLNVNDTARDYGLQVINMLVKYMEDNRDKLIVILAGYKEPTESMIARNPGLKDRIGFHIHFDDYSYHELVQIFHSFLQSSGYQAEKACKPLIEDIFRFACVLISQPVIFSLQVPGLLLIKLENATPPRQRAGV